MPLYEIYIMETNHGVAEIEADSEDEAKQILFDNFDYVHWVDSDIVSIEVAELPNV